MLEIFNFQVVDLTLARDNQLKFEEYLRDNSHVNPGIDLTVTVLTTGFWPSYKSFDLNLPSEMVRMSCGWDLFKFLLLWFFLWGRRQDLLILLYCELFCFRSDAWKFLRASMKRGQNTENLLGYTHWEHATSLASLIQKTLN